ncbi:hypothetical protein HK103_004523 [Boothiomyces macroporosus]|uniref:Uncharacterized protein n=1 Tax=Boothiomyces macroporosus TaxID=261099 RepID=A0AAD5Y8C8_9FUNG|nr:hypothetical protein HK103_004523 [Boothiomyces macroporosus]
MNRNISDSARFEMWLALSNEKELEFSKQNSLDIFEQCLDYLNQRPWSHYILGNYRLVSIMEQFMLLNTGLPFDVGASIAIPILTTINQNKIDEKTWKGIYSQCCLLLGRFFNTEIEKGDGHYSKLSEMSKADFTTLMEDNYLQDFRNLKLQKLKVAEQDVSSADESEYIKPPQYTHRLKVWNKAKQNQKNTVLSSNYY